MLTPFPYPYQTFELVTYPFPSTFFFFKSTRTPYQIPYLYWKITRTRSRTRTQFFGFSYVPVHVPISVHFPNTLRTRDFWSRLDRGNLTRFSKNHLRIIIIFTNQHTNINTVYVYLYSELLPMTIKVLDTMVKKLDGLQSLSDREVAIRDIFYGVRLELLARLHVLNVHAMAQNN